MSDFQLSQIHEKSIPKKNILKKVVEIFADK